MFLKKEVFVVVDEKIVKWVRDTLSKGYSKEQIKNALLQRGFNSSDINDLMLTISQPSTILEAPTPKSHHYGIWWAGLIIILITATVVTLVFTGNLNLDFGKKETTQVNPAQKIATLSKPGVVLIQTVVKGTVYVDLPATEIESNKFLTDTDTGEILPSKNTINQPLELAFGGSGFIISPDGYIITNAHVVSINKDNIINDFMKGFIPSFLDQLSVTYGTLDTKFVNLMTSYLYKHVYFSEFKTEVYVNTGVTIPGVATVQKGNIADIRKLGIPESAKDVAILKIDSKNLPTVKLGNSDEVKTGERIYVFGYPGASENQLTSTQEAIEPTLTSGIISAERKTSDGARLLQTDAALSGGNSGGPAFNEKGEVIGIATLVSIDPFTGQQVAGFNFLVPINFVKNFMNEVNVKSTQSSVDEHYQKGLELFWNKKYNKAINELESVKRLYPAHPYVQIYITEAQEAVEK